MGKKAVSSDNMNQKLALCVRSGKFRVGKFVLFANPFLGYKQAQKSLRQGSCKLIVISNNTPAIRRTNLEYNAILGGSKVLHFEGNNVELGKFNSDTPI